MDPSCLENTLTEDEASHFKENGFLIVPNAIPQSTVDDVTVADNVNRDERARMGREPGARINHYNFIGKHEAFLELVDCPTTFPKVWGILGWNIHLYLAHLDVTPPEPPDRDRGVGLSWHQDSGRVNLEMETSPRPRLSVKVAYFLSDTSVPGRGNFHVIPGSQRKDKVRFPKGDRKQEIRGGEPILAPKGSAVIFDRRLWHARSPNHSPHVRKALFYGYSYRWLRTKDDMTIDPDLLAACDPIRQQLLGQGTNCNGYFSPKDEDVPLKLWFEEHLTETIA